MVTQRFNGHPAVRPAEPFKRLLVELRLCFGAVVALSIDGEDILKCILFSKISRCWPVPAQFYLNASLLQSVWRQSGKEITNS